MKVRTPNLPLLFRCSHHPLAVELGFIISKRGRDIHPSNAHSYIAGYTLAVDMTARNLQSKVKSLGLPWSAAKGFDGFTPISTTFLPTTDVKDPMGLRLTLAVNNEVKQDGKTRDMIFGIPRLIEHISSIMTLEVRVRPFFAAILSLEHLQEGDLILTGTPSGVGPVNPGDHVSCTLEDIASGKTLATLDFDTVQREGGYLFRP